MARSRNIKPGASKNEYLAELGPHAQFLFVMLPTIADREGRLEDRPKRIKADIFPYYEVDVDALLQSLANSPERFVVRYEIDGKRYLQITNFHEHQAPHRNESESCIPPVPESFVPRTVQSTTKDSTSTSTHVVASNKVKGIREEGIRNQESEKRESEGETREQQIAAIVAHYQTYHEKSRPGSKERGKILERLRDGFSVDDLKLAIDGCHVSPWHCGQNERGTTYQTLELIMRDSSKVTAFIEHAACRGDPQLSEKSRRSLTAISSWLDKALEANCEAVS